MSRRGEIVVGVRSPEQRARIAGTGIEVFEVLKVFRAVNEDWDELRASFDWLTEEQLRAALDYAAAHPEAMNERLRAEADAPERIEDLWRAYPELAPKH